jgi:DHA2 family multidrug resistance protein
MDIMETTTAHVADAPAVPRAAPVTVTAPAPAGGGGRKLAAFLFMACGMFMALLDTQILGSSVREIQAGLAATPEEVSLVQTSYLIAEVIMIPMSGWFSRMLSTRWLFTLSATGFTLASIGCGLAWDIESMIVFRALQGFLGGAMIPTAFASGFLMFPGEKNQAKVAAVLGLMATLAPVLGPTIGGLITDAMSWRWLFFVNVVPGIIVAIVVPCLVKIDKPDWGLARRFDYAGALFLALFLGGLQYVLDEGPRLGWLESDLLRGLGAMSLIAAILFLVRSFTSTQAIVNLRAFRNRNFTVGCMLSFIVGIGLYGSIYLTPVFLALIRNYSAVQIGATVFVTGLFQVLATFMSIALRKVMSTKVMLMFGFAIFLLSCLMFRQITADWAFWELFFPQALRGLGTMLCVIPLTSVALGGLDEHEVKGASGIYNLMRNLGGAIGLASINTLLFYSRLTLHFRQLADHMSSASAIAIGGLERLTELVGARIPDPDRAALLGRKLAVDMLRREALVLSFADVYLLMAGAFLFGLALVLLLRLSSGTEKAGTKPSLEH